MCNKKKMFKKMVVVVREGGGIKYTYLQICLIAAYPALNRLVRWRDYIRK